MVVLGLVTVLVCSVGLYERDSPSILSDEKVLVSELWDENILVMDIFDDERGYSW